jgi:hypothetical protein
MAVNAYAEGYYDGEEMSQNDNILNPEQLLEHWEYLLKLEYYKPFQKIQYLTGYRRGATGQPK